MRLTLLAALSLIACAAPRNDWIQDHAQDPSGVVERLETSAREQARMQDEFTRERFETVLPRLMQAEGVQLWVVVAREYNEDPVLVTMLPAEWRNARRTMILLLSAGPEGVERLAVSRYPVGEFFQPAWDPEVEPDPWKAFGALVQKLRPRSIALDVSHDSALADGLTSSLHMQVLKALPPRFEHAVTLRHQLPVRWLESRTEGEQEAYPVLVRTAHDLIVEGLGSIRPGKTTTEDLAWWYEERIRDRGFDTWFHPLVSVQRAEAGARGASFATEDAERTFEPGDLVHIDLGLVWAGLHTDTQHQAYVLRGGESEAPAGLQAGFVDGNRLQELLMERFRIGVTGNELLEDTRSAMEAEGIAGRLYSHPLGLHGHGAGPLIGMWDKQGGVEGRGNLELHEGTAWSIELGVSRAVPEWRGQVVEFMLEEDAFFDGEHVRFLDGRQTEPTLLAPEGGLVHVGLDR